MQPVTPNGQNGTALSLNSTLVSLDSTMLRFKEPNFHWLDSGYTVALNNSKGYLNPCNPCSTILCFNHARQFYPVAISY